MHSTIQQKKLNIKDLEEKVKNMYRQVAEEPHKEYHFEMGRALAEKLGYDKSELDQIPHEAIESFAGVGYFMDIAGIKEGEKILDLGSGSGMDSFIASLKTGKKGNVIGIDMTEEQLKKAKKLANEYGFKNITFVKGYLEELPFEDHSFDVIISNGVINLCPDKAKVFSEAARVLKTGGRMVIADIVTGQQLPESITCDSTLWASCIGGAAQEDTYKTSIEQAGMEVYYVRNNSSYAFISKSAQGASKQYGVKSVSLYAGKNEAAIFKADKMLQAVGLACIDLTPEINKAIKKVNVSQIIEVFNDDPASKTGIPAWCRMTGNELLQIREITKSETLFYIKRTN